MKSSYASFVVIESAEYDDSGLLPGKVAKPMIITVALTGAVPSKDRFPALPTEPDEIANQALACAELGASVVHLHMRDRMGNQTSDPDRLLETLRLIRAGNPELVICATSTSRGAKNFEDRISSLSLPQEELPDMVSLSMGSYNTPTGVNLNPSHEISEIASALLERGVAPELEVFEPGMLYSFLKMHRQGKIAMPAIINILLGVDGASPAVARELVHLVEIVPVGVEWAVAGIGAFQKRMVWLGAFMGGNVRVGMEDDPRGDFEGWNNCDAVRRATRAAEEAGRSIATPRETRTRLRLTVRNTKQSR